jgi:hypothetical protein
VALESLPSIYQALCLIHNMWEHVSHTHTHTHTHGVGEEFKHTRVNYITNFIDSKAHFFQFSISEVRMTSEFVP